MWFVVFDDGDIHRSTKSQMALASDSRILAIRATRRAAEAASLRLRSCEACGEATIAAYGLCPSCL